MPDRPTLAHVRLSALELNGRPIEVTSAELVRIQHWRGEEPAQQEWEVQGRTYDAELRDGTQPIAFVAEGRRFTGRVVLSASRSIGSELWAFHAVGLGDLVDLG
jgi:hypothetical protein